MEKSILEYTIICSEHAPEVANEVNKMIAKGWQPYGSLVKVDMKGLVYQPMVRYERHAHP